MVRVFEQVCDQLRQEILFGEYVVGEKRPSVREIGRQLGVSPTTVREALRVLETERLIETRRGTGIFVAQQSIGKVPIGQYMEWLVQNEQKLQQIFQVRVPLEGMAAALVAETASENVILSLKENMEAQEEYYRRLCQESVNGDDMSVKMDRLNQLAYDFHQIICGATGNDFANEILQEILTFIFDHGEAYLYACWRPCDSVQEHQEILKWIEARNPQKAEEAIRAHIEHGCRNIMPQAQEPIDE